MDTTLTVALIAFVASIISLYVGIIQNRKTRFINIITSERTRWLGKLRVDIAEYCSLCWHLSVGYPKISKEESIKLAAEADKVKILIKLQLNPKEPEAEQIAKRLDTIQGLIHNYHFENFLVEIENLIIESRKYLKGEWEVIKEEAEKGRLNKKPK